MGLHLGLCLDLDQDLELDSDPHLDLHLELNLDPHLDLPLELDSGPHLDRSLGHASFTKDGCRFSTPCSPSIPWEHRAPSPHEVFITARLPCPGQPGDLQGEAGVCSSVTRALAREQRGGTKWQRSRWPWLCSAVRLGLNVLQGGAEVREGDECRKHIK